MKKFSRSKPYLPIVLNYVAFGRSSDSFLFCRLPVLLLTKTVAKIDKT